MTEQPTTPPLDSASPADDEFTPSHLAAEKDRRLAKLAALAEQGTEPYPYRFDRTSTLSELRTQFGELEPGSETETIASVAGRLMLIRRQGKLIFATLRDRDAELQLFVSLAVVGQAGFDAFAELDLGDWVGATGTVMTTRKGELSVKVAEFQLLAKTLRPLPDKWKGLTDTDTRYRQRY
ncbi:MAG: lysS, partial [Acidimicrobiia bacterium]|nr:lysS [Acidimicrobiia bacterium]